MYTAKRIVYTESLCDAVLYIQQYAKSVLKTRQLQNVQYNKLYIQDYINTHIHTNTYIYIHIKQEKNRYSQHRVTIR